MPPDHGAQGGANNEAGARFRAAVGAYLAAHVLAGRPVVDLELRGSSGRLLTLAAETAQAVDDLGCEVEGGGRIALQAKRTLSGAMTGVSPLSSVIGQWVTEAQRDGSSLDPSNHRLIAVTAEASRSVQALGVALSRRRRAEEPTSNLQRDMLVALESRLTQDLGQDAVERVLDCALIWQLHLQDDFEVDARIGQLLLEGSVVPAGEGLTAMAVLRDEVSDLARRRASTDAEGLLAALRRHGIALVADARGAAAARAQARWLAVGRYREQVSDQGNTLDLTFLHPELPHIPLRDVDAAVVPLSDESEADDRTVPLPGLSLAWALRLRRRVLLVGLPGSGKSVALRVAAREFGRRDRWPLPLVVPAHLLVPLLDTMATSDALLQVALRRVEQADRELVREAAEAALQQGDALVVIDGVDEAREHRLALVAAVQSWLAEAHPDTHVAMSTRDEAYAEASRLRFPTFRLDRPQRMTVTTRGLLNSWADVRGLPPADRDAWVEERVSWVNARQRDDPSLEETPLIGLLLTSLAAGDRETSGMLNRPHALRAILDDVVTRWEAARTPVTLGKQLTGTVAVKAVRDSLRQLGRHFGQKEGIDRATLISALAVWLQDEWGVARGPSTVVAEELLDVWDSAGIFVAEGAAPTMRPRLRLFGEIAEADWAAGLTGEDKASWTSEQLHGERSESLVLAAGLDVEILDSLCHPSRVKDGSALPLLHRVLADGARPTQNEPLVRSLTQVLLDTERSTQAGRARAWQAGLALSLLSVPPALRGAADAALNVLPAGNRVLARARAGAHWSPQTADSLLDEMVLLLQEPHGAYVQPDGDWLEGAGVDREYERSTLDSCRRHVTEHPAAVAVAQRRLVVHAPATANEIAMMLRAEGEGHRATDLPGERTGDDLNRRTQRREPAAIHVLRWLALSGDRESGQKAGWERELGALRSLIAFLGLLDAADPASATAIGSTLAPGQLSTAFTATVFDAAVQLSGQNVHALGEAASAALNDLLEPEDSLQLSLFFGSVTPGRWELDWGHALNPVRLGSALAETLLVAGWHRDAAVRMLWQADRSAAESAYTVLHAAQRLQTSKSISQLLNRLRSIIIDQ